ncbi:membrane protein [Capnocytophaga sp. oral taxon 338]|uniref:membrane protein n=1 Tax=Capnocytophaga sp. oral taxon 338 TaxID=710239 RepID=UPI000202B315|nr:membrane protein [Capnocytophaga sp. oral taxon 338]EGD34068.1 membrane protein [Capnocytophaga sp. oral taxon 338 str. F0234]
MKEKLQHILPHLVCILLFVGIALAFFYPILQGKEIQQSDIVQYIGMSKERNDFRQVRESYWTNSAFGGMPTYQLGAEYPYNYIKKLDRVIRFLPRPADYLFLYFISFYIFLLALKVNYRYAFLGALAFGFSTYLIIILTVGHNAKAHAIGYFGFVLAGILLSFQRKYLWGFLLTTLALALEINANHFQMTYYLLLLVIILGGVRLYQAIKNKELKPYIKSVAVLCGAALLAILMNATLLLTTKEYEAFSTRGKSDLTLTAQGQPKTNTTGLSKDYITEYSYGIYESLDLIVPRLLGGSNHENLGEKSAVYNYLIANNYPPNQVLQFTQHLPTYWGEQPIVAAPAYIGIVVFFLFILALFVVKRKAKWWLLAGIVISLLLSWGKNFGLLTNFMIDYFPLYNKFRAVSSVQTILEFCMPALAILGLYQYLTYDKREEAKKYLYYTTAIVGGLLLLLWLAKGSLSFQGAGDTYYSQAYGDDLMRLIRQDRESMYTTDILRSFIYMIIIFGILYAFSIEKLNEKVAFVFITILLVSDIAGVTKRYLSEDSYSFPSETENYFILSKEEKKILEDKEYFRVFSLDEALNGARISYSFHSVGGYHAAKPRRIQELFDYQFYNNKNPQVLNLLNVKYILQTDKEGRTIVIKNPDALGNAWFVQRLSVVENADKLMQSLDTLSPKKNAITSDKSLKDKFYQVDSLASVKLKEYEPDRMVYTSHNSQNGLAVFSEIYYPHGWKAVIDGQKETLIYQVDYTLRAIEIPAGEHTIEFVFSPKLVKIGGWITLFASILFVLITIGAIFVSKKIK